MPATVAESVSPLMASSPRLVVRERRPAVPPVLDDDQAAVVAHRGGPLLVLAGPGTGKTTTLVEAVAARVAEGLEPDRVLALTFSRRAATDLRTRIGERLQRTTAEPAAWTFHAFAFALLRRYSPVDQSTTVRLLSGAEQETVVRELVWGALEDGRDGWPADLAPSLRTRGFAAELRDLLARVRQAGLQPRDLARIARRCARDDWASAATFLDEYLDVLDAQGALDYAELVQRAVAVAARPAVRRELRERFPVVVVDEYQDTDPAQEALLRELAGDGGELLVIGDPDQSIYAFRGAQVANILEFPDRFRRADGSPAAVFSLGVCRRFGEHLLAASRSVAAGIPAPGLPAAQVRAHRALRPAAGVDPGEVRACTYPSTPAQAAGVADLLRRAHLQEGLAWDRMAVLVRSGTRDIPPLRQGLRTAGVPVQVAADELPLAEEPAAAVLLDALAVTADPRQLTAERAQALLTSPLGGADAAAVRRLGRALRDLERVAGATVPRPSAELLREAVAVPGALVAVDERVAAPAQRLAGLLARARAALSGGGTSGGTGEGTGGGTGEGTGGGSGVNHAGGQAGSAEQALWELWDGSGWGRRLLRASRGGGPAAAAADHDLDVVVALFDAFARAEQQRPGRGVANVVADLQAQQIPAGPLDERDVRGGAVRLLTAHRSKGLEWDLVVVCGVQEGSWPDLRRRGSLLEADRLDRSGLQPPPGAATLLAEERRLFYVAATRARRTVVVTAVESAAEDGERPSRFLGELGVPVQAMTGPQGAALALPALVGELRATAVDPDAPPAVREAALDRLARLAAARTGDGTALVPAAHPDAWWGLADWTDPGRPMFPADQPVSLPVTAVGALRECPLRWFLRSEVGAGRPAGAAGGFGGVVHALAELLATGAVPADRTALRSRIDEVWARLGHEARWESEQQRQEAYAAVDRLLAWHTSPRGRTTVAAEAPFEVDLSAAGRDLTLRGRVDRVERDGDGGLHVVDFKTGRTVPTGRAVADDPQLAAYQLAVREGALTPDGTAAHAAGAEIVHLRAETRSGLPKVLPQPALDDGAAGRLLDTVTHTVALLAAERFHPTTSDACRTCEFTVCCPAQPQGRQVTP